MIRGGPGISKGSAGKTRNRHRKAPPRPDFLHKKFLGRVDAREVVFPGDGLAGRFQRGTNYLENLPCKALINRGVLGAFRVSLPGQEEGHSVPVGRWGEGGAGRGYLERWALRQGGAGPVAGPRRLDGGGTPGRFWVAICCRSSWATAEGMRDLIPGN
jgi:hypothetical protein